MSQTVYLVVIKEAMPRLVWDDGDEQQPFVTTDKAEADALKADMARRFGKEYDVIPAQVRGT